MSSAAPIQRNATAGRFFSDDGVDTDDPHHAKVRRQTDEDDQLPAISEKLPGVDPPFTGAEVKTALKAFHPLRPRVLMGSCRSFLMSPKLIKRLEIYSPSVKGDMRSPFRSPEVVRAIYISVIELIVLYASCAWGPATGNLSVRKMLDAVQRRVALKACRGSVYSLPAFYLKRGKDLGNTFVDRELEKPVYFSDLPHPAHVPEIGYENVENLEFQTLNRLAMVGPHIYIDGNRIEGKVGAALTEWQDGELRLNPFCTVFQAKIVALQRAI
ncbi:hypothetical protein EVAR_43535_1 [Eumeta japonica]|uniref:115 kDa protein in type-1 retrotransposable element R1DM n=1 Tax=Eumeta variegata TaxID=151549 RepID=A0A4C1WCF9_EUMVA|nr:hypothetical protein EVAR_43535_1 [Eumeta japonica]